MKKMIYFSTLLMVSWTMGAILYLAFVVNYYRNEERRQSSVKNHPSSNPNSKRTKRPDMGARRVNPNKRTTNNPWFHLADSTVRPRPDSD